MYDGCRRTPDGIRTRVRGFAGRRLASRPQAYELMTGVEPACPAWEADALPLSYISVARLGIEPSQR